MTETTITVEFTLDADDEAKWYVRRMALHEKLSQVYTLELDLAHKAETAAALEGLLGASCCLTITHDIEERYVRGLIRQVTDRGVVGGGGDKYQHASIQVVPALWVLSERYGSRICAPGMSIPEHVAKVMGEGTSPFLRQEPAVDAKRLKRLSEYPKRDYVNQYQETDLNFAMRLLQEEGISFHFDHTDAGKKEQVIFTDSNDSFCLNDEEAGPAIDTWSGEGMVTSFSPAARIGSNKTRTWDTCWTNGNPVDDEISGELLGPAEIELPVYEAEVLTEFADMDSRAMQAQIRLEMEITDAMQAYGSSRLVGLQPGKISEVLTDEFGGKYLITEVAAWYTSGESYGLEGGDVAGEEEYHNEFRCLSTEFVYRPARTIPRPIINGLQPATVVSADTKEEVLTDKHGRVKVNLHWDPEKATSCWMRVAQPWAGQNFGVWFLPRVGMEVAVSFHNGDPDRPIVLGCLHNELRRTYFNFPTEDSDTDNEETKSGIVTKSTDIEKPVKGHNMLWFEDFEKKEEIYLQAQKDMNKVVKDREVIVVGDPDAAEDAPDGKHASRSQEDCRTVLVGAKAQDEFISSAGMTKVIPLLRPQNEPALFGAIQAGSFKVPDDPYAVPGSEMKLVMGNLYEEVRGDVSQAVGTDSCDTDAAKKTGRYRLEVFGNHHVVCQAGDNRYIRGNQGDVTIGSFSREHYGGLYDIRFPAMDFGRYDPVSCPPIDFRLLIGLDFNTVIGAKVEVTGGIGIEIGLGVSLEIRLGPSYEYYTDEWRLERAPEAVVYSEKTAGLIAQKEYWSKTSKTYIAAATKNATEVKKAANGFKKDFAGAFDVDTGGASDAVVARLGKKAVSLVLTGRKDMKKADKKAKKEVKKAVKKAQKEIKDGGQLLLKEKKAKLCVDKFKLEIDKKTAKLTADKHKLEITQKGKVSIKCKEVKMDTNIVRVTKKLKSKNFSAG